MDTITLADHEAAIAQARSDATTAERERITCILQSSAAQSRPAAALRLAMTADLRPDTAETVLAAIPAEAITSPHITGQRAKDAPGGLVVVDAAPGASAQQHGLPQSDFERGAAIMRNLKNSDASGL